MNTISNCVKRKKLKTRKSLNEMRKSHHDDLVRNSKTDIARKISNYKYNKDCITFHRLTLAMFPNAIKSETITRPILAETQKSDIRDVLKYSSLCSRGVDARGISVLGNSSGESSKNKADRVCLTYDKPTNSNKTNDKLNNDNHSSSGSNILCSPGGHEEERNVFISDRPEITSTHTFQVSHVKNGYNLYEEFMNEVPLYLKRNKIVVPRDVTKKIKAHLQSLRIERCYCEPKNNMLEYESTSLSDKKNVCEEVEQNPMDYIRLRYASNHSTVHSSESPSCLSLSSSVDCSLSPSPTTLIQDTPEYNYYPHKLNHCG